MELKKINFNSYIQVQLNEKGKLAYRKYVSSAVSLMPETEERKKQAEEEIYNNNVSSDGQMTTNFIEISQVFGQLIGTKDHPFTSMEFLITDTSILANEPNVTR